MRQLPPIGDEDKLRPLKERLFWFVALWLLGFGAVVLVSFILRLWIAPA
ncbi:MAG TPA: DUF2474 domain-containing protein [Xanthobacteraceae bacterium]|nr:DUF2474 domain-containing protein [Xanthobacteraceae bacterium]HWW49336.1 DUF2474 domain-containing protein [Xanthobacteraceae bacterium]